MQKLVIFTGAGMSAESGISTFRDSGGLWDEYNVNDVATPEGFARNPEFVLEFYNRGRRQMSQCQPNDGHLGLAALEKEYEVQIITQNVDNLHERAGSTHVLHLHGEMMKVCPVGDWQTVYELSPDKPDIHLGDTDPKGRQLRPYVVWFGEAVPLIETAAEMVEQSDVLVVIGSSLQVYPAASLLRYARRGQPIYIIDPKEVDTNLRDVHHIRAGASEGVRQLAQLLKE